MNILKEIANIISLLKEDNLKKNKENIKELISIIKANIIKKIEKSESIEMNKKIHMEVFGKKGYVQEFFQNMKKLNDINRPIFGKIIHDFKSIIEKELKKKEIKIRKIIENEKLENEKIDITLPGAKSLTGSKHPITRIEEEIKNIFIGLGYSIVDGFEIEEDYYNFERLNISKNHPARDMQDSFYIDEKNVLRTHTSPVQARIMDKMCPKIPIKVISCGKVYRRDNDATHSPMFHQVEGLYIGKKISFSDLKGTLFYFLQKIFGNNRKIRLRPSYFPFTEPSAEIDVSCNNCLGKGCNICSNTGWLEVLGGGMVHPKVLEMSGYNSNKVQGFAFGAGIERICMLKYGINDIRMFYDNDQRFLKQFGGK